MSCEAGIKVKEEDEEMDISEDWLTAVKDEVSLPDNRDPQLEEDPIFMKAFILQREKMESVCAQGEDNKEEAPLISESEGFTAEDKMSSKVHNVTVKVEAEESAADCEEYIQISEDWLKAVKAENSPSPNEQPQQETNFTQDNGFILQMTKVKSDHEAEEDEEEIPSSSVDKDHIISCQVCQRYFTNEQDLQQHMKVHGVEGPFIWTLHRNGFGHEENLQIHKLSHPVGLQDNEPIYMDLIFNKGFPETLFGRYVLFRKEKEPYSSDQCNKHNTSQKSLVCSHKLTYPGETPCTCNYCKKLSKRKNTLQTHMPIHSLEKPHTGDQCGKNFKTRPGLHHYKLIHTGEKPHTCDQCEKGFRTKGELHHHKLIHTGEKPHACDQCEKSFRTKGELKKHKRMHTGEKPHVCDQCGKSFRTNGDLKRHRMVHTGEKPHTCDRCGKRYQRRGDLIIHKKLHTGKKPHACDQCGKRFTRKGRLNYHKLLHTLEVLYTCGQCGKSFTTREMSSHLLTHTEETQYTCDLCGKNFRASRILWRHKQSHASSDVNT